MVAVAVVAGGALAAGGSLLGASKQAKAAKDASAIQAESADQALQLQREMYQQTRADLRPWYDVGQTYLSNLQGLTFYAPERYQAPAGLDPAAYQFQGPGPFRPPTPEEAAADPGYQFRLQQGTQAITGNAAARGLLQSGATAQAVTRYGQDVASQEYGNVYTRRTQEYANDYNQRMQQNQLAYGRALAANTDAYQRGLQEFQSRQNAQANRWNQFSQLAGYGNNALQLGQQANQNYTSGLSSLLLQQGNAQAAGQMGAANAWSQGLSGVSGALQGGINNYLLMQGQQASPGVLGQGQYPWGGYRIGG